MSLWLWLGLGVGVACLVQGDDVALHARLVLLLRLQLIDEGVGRAGEAVELAWLGLGLGLGLG